MTTLNDVKAFLADNGENEDVQNFVKGLVGDERMLALAMESDKGQMFFQKQFDRKISEAKKKMEANYESKLQESLSSAEASWVDKYKKAETKTPTELKLEEMQKKLEAQERMLKQKEIMSALQLPDPLKKYSSKLIDDSWSIEDAKAFSESAAKEFNEYVAAKIEERISGNKTAPGGISNPPKQSSGSVYANMTEKQLAALPEAEYKQAIAELMNKK